MSFQPCTVYFQKISDLQEDDCLKVPTLLSLSQQRSSPVLKQIATQPTFKPISDLCNCETRAGAPNRAQRTKHTAHLLLYLSSALDKKEFLIRFLISTHLCHYDQSRALPSPRFSLDCLIPHLPQEVSSATLHQGSQRTHLQHHLLVPGGRQPDTSRLRQSKADLQQSLKVNRETTFSSAFPDVEGDCLLLKCLQHRSCIFRY